jgi:hypothetical protein
VAATWRVTEVSKNYFPKYVLGDENCYEKKENCLLLRKIENTAVGIRHAVHVAPFNRKGFQ